MDTSSFLTGGTDALNFRVSEPMEEGTFGLGFYGVGCGACFQPPKQFLEDSCCHRGTECDYYAIDLTLGAAEVIVPGYMKSFEDLPLEIKLY